MQKVQPENRPEPSAPVSSVQPFRLRVAWLSSPVFLPRLPVSCALSPVPWPVSLCRSPVRGFFPTYSAPRVGGLFRGCAEPLPSPSRWTAEKPDRVTRPALADGLRGQSQDRAENRPDRVQGGRPPQPPRLPQQTRPTASQRVPFSVPCSCPSVAFLALLWPLWWPVCAPVGLWSARPL